MTSAARLFDALPDFGPRPRASAQGHAVDPPTARGPSVMPAPDTTDIVRRDVERAEQAMAERFAQEHEAILQEMRAEHEAELGQQARYLGELAGQTIAARLGEMEAQVVAHVTSAVARIVGGVLSDDLQKRSIDSLARNITAAIADRDTIRIEIRGPQSMFEALVAALPDRTGSIDYVERDGFDLTVTVDGDLFETRLAEWSSALSEILQ